MHPKSRFVPHKFWPSLRRKIFQTETALLEAKDAVVTIKGAALMRVVATRATKVTETETMAQARMAQRGEMPATTKMAMMELERQLAALQFDAAASFAIFSLVRWVLSSSLDKVMHTAHAQKNFSQTTGLLHGPANSRHDWCLHWVGPVTFREIRK